MPLSKHNSHMLELACPLCKISSFNNIQAVADGDEGDIHVHAVAHKLGFRRWSALRLYCDSWGRRIIESMSDCY